MPAFRSPVDGALFLFDRGHKVFPLGKNNKKPFGDGWQDWAKNAKREHIISYNKRKPGVNWGVMSDGSETFIDLDMKDGQDGVKAMNEFLKESPGLPETFTVETPSKGYHLYYTGRCPNTNRQLGEGIETRCKGQYIVAPGSVIDGKEYKVIKDIEVKEIPSWFVKKVREIKKPVVLDDRLPIMIGSRVTTLASIAGSMRSRGMGYEAIKAALEVLNYKQSQKPLPASKIEDIARQISKYQPHIADTASSFVPISVEAVPAVKASSINPGAIPKRDWIMSERYIANFVSVIIAPGGVGKSILSILDAIAVATGKPLTGYHVKAKAPVWIHNAEDPADELHRRIAAVSDVYDIPLKSLNNVHVTSGREYPLIFAKNDPQHGLIINEDAVSSVIDYIGKNGIRLFIVDPFIRLHEVEENGNNPIDKVAQVLQRVSEATKCAIGVVHHTSKAGAKDAPGDMHSGRGATSLIYAVRIAHTLSTMSEDDARKFGISPDRRKWYIRLDNAKSNLAPPAEKAVWFEKVSTELVNGDNVGTIRKADLVMKAEIQRQEEIAANKRDLEGYLRSFMKPGGDIAVNDLIQRIACDGSISHLFGDIGSSRRQREMLLNIIFNGLDGFEYEERENSRPRHWLKCVKELKQNDIV